MGGGGHREFSVAPQLAMALFAAANPDYGKMAADSIAKEVEERGLIAPTQQPPVGANGHPAEAATTSPPADNGLNGSGNAHPSEVIAPRIPRHNSS